MAAFQMALLGLTIIAAIDAFSQASTSRTSMCFLQAGSTHKYSYQPLHKCGLFRPERNVGKSGRKSLLDVRAMADKEPSEQDREAADEAAKWREMALRMEQQRSSNAAPQEPNPVSGEASSAKQPSVIKDLSSLEGTVLPEPGIGELEALMAKAEAFKAKGRAAAGLSAPLPSETTLPRRFQGSNNNAGGTGPAQPGRLVGGDAGSRRQAAPYRPGESKAGALQEGWTDDQLEKILGEEAKWKEQVAQKRQEEQLAQDIANNADALRLSPAAAAAAGGTQGGEVGVPGSMESAVVQALAASLTVMRRGCGRLRVDVDTSGGDETYTPLKNAIPFTRALCKGLAVNGFSKLRIVFPDPGAAALAARDWARVDGHETAAFERSGKSVVQEGDEMVVVVAAAATEIERLRGLAQAAGEMGIPLLLVNPSVKSPGGENLGSLGAYSLSLQEFLGTFETAYFLRTLGWGVLMRAFPGGWCVYNEAKGRGGYELVETLARLPGGETLEKLFYKANPDQSQDALGSLAAGLTRFINNYSRG